uniref:Phospholipase A(2) n=1 Tax=Meloidogyne hapla TaxID=6305 RepID=A0A1I8BYW2_MELHA
MTIKCMAERNDYCQQTLCLCDSTLASCWSKIPAPQSSPGCFSCYLDDARNYVSGPINEVIDIRSRYLPRELELSLHIFDVREGKDVPKANDAIILAVMDVNSGIDSVRQSQIEMDKIIHETRNLIKEDAENYEKFLSSNDDLRAKASKCNVEFRSLMLRIAPHLYINEQLLTYDASKRVLNATKHLEALILNMKEEKMVNGKK